MKFLKTFFSKKKEDKINFDVLKNMDHPNINFNTLLEQQGAYGFEKQKVFHTITGKNSWNINIEEGKITFEDNHIFSFQVIGTLSFTDYSWLWAWANSKSNIPEDLLKTSIALKEKGETFGIKELTTKKISAEEGFEHKIGLIASTYGNSYFCANYENGTMVIVISDDTIPKINKTNISSIISTFPEFISSIDINHKKSFIGYIQEYFLEWDINENKITGSLNGNSLEAEFDKDDRLISLKASI